MLSIPEALKTQAQTAIEKVHSLRTPGRFALAGLLGGAYIGVGIVVMLSVAGPLFAAGDGLAKLVSGLVFGTALTLVVFAGADLATSAMMVLPQGTLMRAIRLGPATVTLIIMFLMNLIGSLVFSALIVASGVIRTQPAAESMLTSVLAGKAAQDPLDMLIRGLLCNALVCLAVWMGVRVSSELARIALIFIAITAFVVSGFEHVIANMTAYGIGLFSGDPNAAPALFASNLLWVGLGNLLGGGLVVGVGYWVLGGRPRVTPHDRALQSAPHPVSDTAS